MKINKTIAGLGAVVLALSISACGGSNSTESAESTTLKVGATPNPHAKILKFVKDNLAKKEGIDLEIITYQDYVQPNEALKVGDIDANYYQTVPYLKEQSTKRGYKFVAGKGIHLEPLGLYSNKLKDVKDIKDGATIGVINDPTNQNRAIQLLGQAGLLKIDPKATDLNVAKIKSSATANPKNLKFQMVEGPQLIRSLADVDAAVINGNYALEGGKKPSEAIFLESTKDNPNSNPLVWAENTKKKAALEKLEKLLHSDEVRQFIEKTYPDKSVIPSF